MSLPLNPGGVLEPHQVIGRDVLITRLWKTLEVQSLELHAERRMGKTSILKKMVAEPQAGFIPLYRDLEDVQKPEEFLEYVMQDVWEKLGKGQKIKEVLKNAWQTIGGAEVGGKFKIPSAPQYPWKHSLQTLLREVAQQVKDERVVFLWDEIPLMLQNIKRIQGEKVAMEVLDTLRAIRHDTNTQSLRMVFTGSIGLHHVLTELREAGHANKPVNDMASILVPGLALPDACLLAEGLLEGIGVVNASVAAREIAMATDCIPFYIHHLVQRVEDHPSGTTDALEHLDRLRNALLFDPQDALDLRYYRERITTYYREDRKALALAILDALAHKEPFTFSKLSSQIILKIDKIDEEGLRETLTLLESDHYLERDAKGYQFQRKLIRDGWRALRGIG
jgi:hypothetical protein